MRDRGPDGRDDVLRRLTELAETGTPPNAIALLPEHAGVVELAIAWFGNLAVARQRMPGGWRRGADYETKASVRGALARLHAAGQLVTPRRLRLLGEEQLIRAVYRHFGNFARARTAAGLAPRQPAPARHVVTMTRDEALEQYRALMAADPMRRADTLPRHLRRALRLHVGGISHARRECDLPKFRWNRERVLAVLAEYARAGHAITTLSLNRSGRDDLVNAIYRHVGSIVEARAEAFALADIPGSPGPAAAAGGRVSTRHGSLRSAPRRPTPKQPMRKVGPNKRPNNPEPGWAAFRAACESAARRGAGPPPGTTRIVPEAILAGAYRDVAGLGDVLVELMSRRADLLDGAAPREDHVMMAGLFNALECTGVDVPPLLGRRARAWIETVAPPPTFMRTVLLARLAAAHAMSRAAAKRASAQELLRERERKLENLFGWVISRRRRKAHHAAWLRLIQDGELRGGRIAPLEPIELLWAARIRYQYLDGHPAAEVAARLAVDFRRKRPGTQT